MTNYTTPLLRKDAIRDKLKEYSLLAGSILASSFAAQGQVLYTDVIPDKELGGIIPDSLPYNAVDSLDLNNDGIFDFEITLDMYGALPGGFSFKEEIRAIGFQNWVLSYTIDYLKFAVKKDTCDNIPAGTYLFGSVFADFAFRFPNKQSYIWDDEHDKYVGLKVVVGGEIHHAWVRLDVNTLDSIPNIIIKDYAYEDTVGKPISTCDTGLGQPDHVGQLVKPDQLSVFPNPSDGKGMIKLEQPLTGEIEITVNDAYGRKVYQSSVSLSGNRRELPFDFSNFAPGIYFIELKSESVSLSEKWIKN